MLVHYLPFSPVSFLSKSVSLYMNNLWYLHKMKYYTGTLINMDGS